MKTDSTQPRTISEYISLFPRDIREVLEKIRRTIRRAAPDAEETISYRIPAFKSNGALVYFAAFTNHIGFYPPVRGDAALEKAVSKYAGEKGNLKFPLDEPVPYSLIARIVKLRVKQNAAKPPVRRKHRKGAVGTRRRESTSKGE